MINTYILNAEDDRATREVIQDLLESTGESYIVEQVKDGNEFNNRLDDVNSPIDIAILDIHMPDFDILEAVDRLWKEWKQTYVIVSSADDDLSVILELQNKYHIWGYVLKGDTNKDFGKELEQLVRDAHLKVQNKNEYIERQIQNLLLTNGTTYQQ